MLAEQTHLKLVEDLNETALVELGAADVDEVSGALLPLAIPLGVKIGAAIVGGVATGALIGWLVNR